MDEPIRKYCGHVEPVAPMIVGSIEIPNGVDVKIAFERIEGGYRLIVYNAGEKQSIELKDGFGMDALGLSIVGGAINVTFEEEDET